MSFSLRKFKPSEYSLLKSWVTAQKWNPGLHDHQAQQILNGFWMGLVDQKPIGCFGGIQYDENYAHLAWYIVQPEFRSKGYGTKLWDITLGSLSSKTIGLYAVKGKQVAYAQQGFFSVGKTGSYSILSKGKRSHSDQLMDCKKIEIQKLSKFDREHFPSERKQFIKKWINLPGSHSLAVISKNQIQGYGVIRPAVQGHKIGPLFANQYEVAKQIYSGLVSKVSEGERVFIDVPDNNPNGMRLVEEQKMSLMSLLTRMYSNGEPDPKIRQKVYGSTAFSLG